MSLIRGWEVALAERKMLLEYGSLNTMFQTWDLASNINERAYYATDKRRALKQELISATSSILQIRQQTALDIEKHL